MRLEAAHLVTGEADATRRTEVSPMCADAHKASSRSGEVMGLETHAVVDQQGVLVSLPERELAGMAIDKARGAILWHHDQVIEELGILGERLSALLPMEKP